MPEMYVSTGNSRPTVEELVLGLYVNRRNIWNNHISEIAKSLTKFLNGLKCLTKLNKQI